MVEPVTLSADTNHRVWVVDLGERGADTPGRRAVVRGLLAGYLVVPEADISLHADPHGRLSLCGIPGADVSASHAGSLLVAGACRGGRIGVDVEVIRPDLEVCAIAREQFTEREWAAYRALPEEARPEAFYRVWTAKEALLKAIGLGMGMGLSAIETGIMGPDAVALRAVHGSAALADGWRLAYFRVRRAGGDALVAVVTGGAG